MTRRICVQISTKRVLEMQTSCPEGQLISNAINLGYDPADLEEQEVDDAGYAAAKALDPVQIAIQQAKIDQYAKQKAKLDAIIAELPSWITLRDEIEAIIVAAQAATTVNQLSKPLVDLAKHYRKKLKILYWLAKGEDD